MLVTLIPSNNFLIDSMKLSLQASQLYQESFSNICLILLLRNIEDEEQSVEIK